MMSRSPRLTVAACLAGLAPAVAAHAVDLSVASVEITQGLQSAAGDIPLIARNATLVRVKVSLNGALDPEPGVDAVLRIYANGIEIPESPVYSSNGPITAPLAPSADNAQDTINFHCLPPEGADIDFVVATEGNRQEPSARRCYRIAAQGIGKRFQSSVQLTHRFAIHAAGAIQHKYERQPFVTVINQGYVRYGCRHEFFLP